MTEAPIHRQTKCVNPVAILMACNADRWATRTFRNRAHLYITPTGLEYRS